MCPVRFVTYVSGRSLPLTNTLTVLRGCCFCLRICSASSANNARLRIQTQFESKTHLFCPVLTELQVFPQLLSVTGRHISVFVPHPIVDQDLSYLTALKRIFPETEKRKEA